MTNSRFERGNFTMKSIELSPNEQIDDLQIMDLKIIQKKDGFKFGTDAVLLSDFAKSIQSEHTLDLCTGTGIIPLLLRAKSKTRRFTAVEIQQEMADMAKKSMLLNNLSDEIEVVCEDLKNSVKLFGKRKFDLITCNPPYIRSGVLNSTDTKTVSRHEILCTLEDIIRVSSDLLTTTGRLCIVHRPSRVAELLYLMKANRIEPKRIRFVHKNQNEPPVLVLVEGLFGGGCDVNVMKPLIMYKENFELTDEMKEIYNFD